jgi:DNA polymerase-3 subunit gamma/tau
MLLKGLDDLRIAPSPLLAAEMLIIRLAHAADLPSAETMLAMLQGHGDGGPPSGGAGVDGSMGTGGTDKAAGLAASAPSRGDAAVKPVAGKGAAGHAEAMSPGATGQGSNGASPPPSDASALDQPKPAGPRETGKGSPPGPARPVVNGNCQTPAPAARTRSSNGKVPRTFEAVVDLFRQHRKPLLHGWLHGRAKLVRFETGRIMLEQGDQLLSERRQEMASLLRTWTGEPWQILESDQEGAPSLTDQEAEAKRLRLTELADDPRIKPVLDIFPGARIIDVTTPAPLPADHTTNPEQNAEA